MREQCVSLLTHLADYCPMKRLSLCQSGVEGKRHRPLSSWLRNPLFLLSLSPPQAPGLGNVGENPSPPRQPPLRAGWINEVMSPKNVEFLGRKASTCKVVVVTAITSLSRVSQLSWWKRGQQSRMPASPSGGAAGTDYK